MTMRPLPPEKFEFGPFTVESGLGELRRDGLRLRLAGQPFRILLALVARPGELVTREELKAEVWGEATFVDFEHGLNAAVNKLRRALGEGAGEPRYVETVPGRGYRFIGTLNATEAVAGPVEIPAPVEISERHAVWQWWVAGAAIVAASFWVGWRLHEKSVAAPAVWTTTRLTADKGITNESALSRDGKMVVFSSDRSGQGGMDLYVMQVNGGTPVRLTTDGANDGDAEFSPDGSKIVFDSNRDGGGVYEMAALGGEMRLLARHGLNPRYSPDGSEVAYWVGDPNIAPTVPGGGEVWVIPEAGGSPRRVGSNFSNARYPIWAPDGRHLLLNGYTASKAGDNTALDWWVVATHGDDAVRTGFYEALAGGGLQSQGSPTTAAATFAQMPIAGCWLKESNSIVFSARTGGSQSIWEADISRRTNRATGNFRRLTAGAGDESQARCSSGDAITFTSGEDRLAVWSMKANLNVGRLEGEPVLLTIGSTDREPALSGDGRYVAFSSARSGLLNIWMRELATGTERHLAASAEGQRFPQADETGERVAYSVFEKSGTRSIYLWSRDEAPQKLCADCLRATGWTPDGKQVVIFGGAPLRIDLVDVKTHEQTPLLSHKTYSIVLGRVSPDGRWISFTARVKANKATIMVAPMDAPHPIPESAWIKIADEAPEDRAGWSPDGKLLYFSSERDGHRCFYAQRIDAFSGRPIGEAFAVQHFHRSLWYLHGGWSSAAGRIVFGLVDGRENVWMMSRANGG